MQVQHCRERGDELHGALGDGVCVRSVQIPAEYKTLQAQPLESEMRWVFVANATCACSNVGNARGKLHRALRDLKCEGRSPINSLGFKSVVT